MQVSIGSCRTLSCCSAWEIQLKESGHSHHWRTRLGANTCFRCGSFFRLSSLWTWMSCSASIERGSAVIQQFLTVTGGYLVVCLVVPRSRRSACFRSISWTSKNRPMNHHGPYVVVVVVRFDLEAHLAGYGSHTTSSIYILLWVRPHPYYLCGTSPKQTSSHSFCLLQFFMFGSALHPQRIAVYIVTIARVDRLSQSFDRGGQATHTLRLLATSQPMRHSAIHPASTSQPARWESQTLVRRPCLLQCACHAGRTNQQTEVVSRSMELTDAPILYIHTYIRFQG